MVIILKHYVAISILDLVFNNVHLCCHAITNVKTSVLNHAIANRLEQLFWSVGILIKGIVRIHQSVIQFAINNYNVDTNVKRSAMNNAVAYYPSASIHLVGINKKFHVTNIHFPVRRNAKK